MKDLPRNWKIIFTLAAVLIVFWLLWLFRSIITYLVIAVVISFICEPVSDLLKRIRIRKYRLPSWFRALSALMVFISLLLFMAYVFTPLITEEVAVISEIDASVVAGRIIGDTDPLSNQFADYVTIDSVTEYLVNGMQEMFSVDKIESIFNGLFGLLGSALVGIFAVLFITFFFLRDGFLFARIIFTLTPEKHLEKMKSVMEHTHDLLRRYFIGVALQSLIMSLMVGIPLYILDVHNALLIGLFAGLVNVIPYIGPLIGASLGILIALTTSLHLHLDAPLMPVFLKVGAVFLCAQLLDSFLVQPFVLGGSVKAHPLEIFIVILMAGTIGGVAGMVLAIPVYTILRVVAREFLSEFKLVESLTRDLRK